MAKIDQCSLLLRMGPGLSNKQRNDDQEAAASARFSHNGFVSAFKEFGFVLFSLDMAATSASDIRTSFPEGG